MMTCNTPGLSRSRRPALGVLILAVVAMAIGLSACAPKITKIDVNYTMPEGVVSHDAAMLVWGDMPSTGYIFGDLAPVDPDSLDTLITTQRFERYSPNVIHGMIIDRTMANGFQLFRREAGGSVRQYVNYEAPRVRQWLASQYEAYHFVDVTPSNYRPSTYIGRGIVEDIVSPQSPLTNLAMINPAPLVNISLKAVWWLNENPTKGPVFRHDKDANPVPKIKLSWSSVPFADHYLVQVFEYRSDLRSNDERILSGTPAPFYDGQSTDLFIGYVPAGVNFMLVGDSTAAAPAGITTFQIKPLASSSSLLARIAAIDAAGRMIGLTGMSSSNPLTAFKSGEMGLTRVYKGPNTYLLYPLSATAVKDTSVRPPPTGGGGGGLGL